MAINEGDQDQRGGQLTFDNGETLNYEGRLPASGTPYLFGSFNSSNTNSVLAVCIGSHWPGPLNFPSSKEELNEFIGEWRSKFRDAEDILLVGAGAVGLGMMSNLFSTLLLTDIIRARGGVER